MACNRKEIVDAVLERLRGVDNFDKPVQLQVMKEKLTPNGKIFFFGKIIDRVFTDFNFNTINTISHFRRCEDLGTS